MIYNDGTLKFLQTFQVSLKWPLLFLNLSAILLSAFLFILPVKNLTNIEAVLLEEARRLWETKPTLQEILPPNKLLFVNDLVIERVPSKNPIIAEGSTFGHFYKINQGYVQGYGFGRIELKDEKLFFKNASVAYLHRNGHLLNWRHSQNKAIAINEHYRALRKTQGKGNLYKYSGYIKNYMSSIDLPLTAFGHRFGDKFSVQRKRQKVWRGTILKITPILLTLMLSLYFFFYWQSPFFLQRFFLYPFCLLFWCLALFSLPMLSNFHYEKPPSNDNLLALLGLSLIMPVLPWSLNYSITYVKKLKLLVTAKMKGTNANRQMAAVTKSWRINHFDVFNLKKAMFTLSLSKLLACTAICFTGFMSALLLAIGLQKVLVRVYLYLQWNQGIENLPRYFQITFLDLPDYLAANVPAVLIFSVPLTLFYLHKKNVFEPLFSLRRNYVLPGIFSLITLIVLFSAFWVRESITTALKEKAHAMYLTHIGQSS